MTRPTLDREVFADASWWHWMTTIPLIVAHLAGISWAMAAVIVLSAVAGGYFWYCLRRLQPYPVQVRLAYMVWSAVGLLPGMQWMHWIQLVGTTAMVAVGYCPLIRLLSLLPFNRTEPLTPGAIWQAFVTDPCSGGLLAWPTPSNGSAGGCCAVRTDLSTCSVHATAALTCALPNSLPNQKENRHAHAH